MLSHLLLVALFAAADGEVVARVNSDTITAQELRARSASGTNPRDSLDQMIDMLLLAQDGYRQKLDQDPAVRARLDQLRRERAVESLLANEIRPSIKIDEALLQKTFHARTDVAELSMLVVDAEAKAKGMVDRLRLGGDWAGEARSSLGGPSSGAKMSVTRGQMEPGLGDAVFAAPVGETVGPIRTHMGWAIIKVYGRKVGDAKTYRKQRDSYVSYARQQAEQAAIAKLTDELRAKAKVTIDEKLLESTGSTATATPQERERPVAVVGGRTLRYGDILADLAEMAGGKPDSPAAGPKVKIEIARRRVDRMLLEDAAVARGHHARPAVAAEVKDYERRVVREARVKQLTAPLPDPTDADARAYYQAHASEFMRPAHRKCSHIVVASKNLATDLGQRARKGEKFSDLAKKYSTDKASAAQGGVIGDITDAQLETLAGPSGEPQLSALIRGARPGEITQPTHSQLGWHIFACEKTTPAELAPFDEVMDSAKNRAKLARVDDVLSKRAAELRAQAKISVDEQALARAATRAPARGKVKGKAR